MDEQYLSEEFLVAYINEIETLLLSSIKCGKYSKSAIFNLTKELNKDIYACLNYINLNLYHITPIRKAELKTKIIQLDLLRCDTIRNWSET